MFQKLTIALMFLVALSAFVSSAIAADKIHDGLVVSAADGKLVMTDKDGKNQHTHMVATTTKITLNGKEAKLTDLKKGDAVKVTADPEGKIVAIAATRA